MVLHVSLTAISCSSLSFVWTAARMKSDAAYVHLSLDRTLSSSGKREVSVDLQQIALEISWRKRIACLLTVPKGLW